MSSSLISTNEIKMPSMCGYIHIQSVYIYIYVIVVRDLVVLAIDLKAEGKIQGLLGL